MKCEVAIVGSGLVGASLAASLHGAGLRIALLDAQAAEPVPQLGWDSRVYAISPGSQQFLAACGAWQRIPSNRIARVDAMQVHGDSDDAEIRFSAYQAGLPELCFIVE
ncbi:MAG: ubiquinone biosynthesis protein UbiH, partial [Betaproteobacteria bacterium]